MKQVFILAIFAIIEEVSIETNSMLAKIELPQVLCILYPSQFVLHVIKTLINFSNKINIMRLNFREKLDFYI